MPAPGEPFEKLVAQIQARIDPASQVTHNEFLVDRLNQRRQFDVVIRGDFAGQKMLGVIECKDLDRKVGTPEIDAFNTKAQDINANFKVIASKRGFTKPALRKAQHYGIRLVSLLDSSVQDGEFAIGDWWAAKLLRWSRLSIQAYPVNQSKNFLEVAPQDLQIDGCRIIDWFTNYLLREGHKDQSVGWVVEFQLSFDHPVLISTPNTIVPCKTISFHAERECLEFERFVPLFAEAFVDWLTRSAAIPPNTNITMGAVPADFREWSPRNTSKTRTSSLLGVSFKAEEVQFEHVKNVPDLESMSNGN